MTKPKFNRLVLLFAMAAQACGALVDHDTYQTTGLREVSAELTASMGTPDNARMALVWDRSCHPCAPEPEFKNDIVQIRVAIDLGSAVVTPTTSLLFSWDEPPPAGIMAREYGSSDGGLIVWGMFVVYADNNGNGELDLRTIENPDTADSILAANYPYDFAYVEGEVLYGDGFLPQWFNIFVTDNHDADYTTELTVIEIDVPEVPSPDWDDLLCGEDQTVGNRHPGILLDLELRDDGHVYLPDGTDFGEFTVVRDGVFLAGEIPIVRNQCEGSALIDLTTVETITGPCSRTYDEGTVRITNACEADCAGIEWPCT